MLNPFSVMISLPFLKEIAAILLQPGEYDLSGTCVVFPNKRARLYLSKYMGELTNKPVWAPHYLSINELMESLSGYIYADRLTILFELFEIYKLTTGSAEDFDHFFPYAEPLLADFDEIDKYLVNAADLFSNLAGIKNMEASFSYLTEKQIAAIRQFWSTFDPENTSPGQKTFTALWNLLPDMYSGLRDRLAQKGMAYEGMAYRKVSEDLTGNKQMDGFSCQKYLFVGFNALNKCEENLFRYLKNAGKADFYWDYDSWYTNNDIHEAGLFIRRNLGNFPPARQINHENLTAPEKHIYFLPVPSNTGQAESLPYIFEKLGIQSEADAGHTALVLADENLLIPVLYAIPATVPNLNITMGYPLAGSAVFNLVDSLYELGKNRRIIPDAASGYYFKNVLSVLGNPLLKNIFGSQCERVRQLVVEKNLVYLSKDNILPEGGDDVIFQEEVGKQNAVDYLLHIVEYLLRRLAGKDNDTETDPVQLEILYQVYTFLTRLKDILAHYTFVPEQETLFRLIRRMLRTLHIPFSGEPLSGLQLLGILETRTLDFDHVIILSMNEGVLPRTTAIPSFIPHNLRFGFGMPTPEHHDAMYAYYFYRLIQRASNVVLVYDSSTGGLRTGERSRFLHQLYYELPVPVTEINPVFSIDPLPVLPIVVEKTDDVARFLEKYSGDDAKLLSPSAINEFLNCPLRFYFHHIAGLPQPEDVTEEIDARMFGNLLHKAMQIIYGGFGTSLITQVQLEQLLKNDVSINNALDKAFSEVLFGDEDSRSSRKIEGFNLIVRQIIKSYIRNLIRTDGNAGSFNIVNLEMRYTTIIPLSVEGRALSVQVGGTIDRVERIDGRIRIIDYKTGTVKKNFSTLESLFDGEEKARNDAVFQVLMYSMVYHLLNPESTVVPGLCFVRGSNAENFSYNIHYGEKKKALESYQEIKADFEKLLLHHLSRLFNTREPFTQTSNLQICGTCPYAVICRKEETMP